MTDAYQFWVPFNLTYGPWYRATFSSKGQMVTAVVQPDMEPGRFFWSIRFPAYNPKPYTGDPNKPHTDRKPLKEYRVGGHAPTLEEAQGAALAAAKIGRPK